MSLTISNANEQTYKTYSLYSNMQEEMTTLLYFSTSYLEMMYDLVFNLSKDSLPTYQHKIHF